MNLFTVKQNLIASALLILVASCNTPKEVVIDNNSNEERKDELVVLKRDKLENIIGNMAPGKYLAIKGSTGVPVVVQYDDLDGDRQWDEAAFLYSFKPNEKLTVNGEFTNAPATVKAMVRAHVRQMKKNADNTFGPVAVDKDTMPVNAQPTDFSKQALPPYLTEGPAWENDKVGFRIYFDVRNDKDIWGKTTNRMVLDEVGTDATHSYHELSDWGMDILKVGASLGAGALALEVPLPNGKDTLVRLGGSNIEQVTYEKLADGPVRAICRLTYKNWKVASGLAPVSVTEEISIWGGQYFYESKVWVKDAPAGSKLVTGIVNFNSKQLYETGSADYKAIYTFDTQSENKDKLGMAIVMPAAQAAGAAATPNANTDIQNTYIMKANIKNNEPVVFRFYACWEKTDSRFASLEGFKKFIESEINKKPLLRM
jgi:hypothetical protein